MKTRLLLLVTCLLCSRISFCQNDNASLLVQSPDGKTVRLTWFLKSWNPEITGFDIKRKEGLEDWVKLNSEPIVPGISLKRKFAITEPDNAEESRIKDKLYDMIRDKKIKETDSSYLARLSSDNKTLQETERMIAEDYDVAMMSGFAYVDNKVTKKTNYEYGLFIKGTDKLLAHASWNYGEIPDLNVVREITSRTNPGKKGIAIIWYADMNKMRTANVAGFNIYREGIRVNDNPITAASAKDPSEFSWESPGANPDEQHQYSISAASVLGVEGIIKPYTFNPIDHPKEYKKAEVTGITPIGYYFKDGIDVQWQFPAEYEHFIKGFYVEKDNMPDGYDRVSQLLDRSARTFTDHSSSPVTGYIRFRITAVYNDQSVVAGKDRLYNYFPMREPPRPQNIKHKGTGVMEDKKYAVTLSWDPPMAGDSITTAYRVYMFDPMNNRLNALIEKQPAKNTSYKYVVQHGTSTILQFCVTAMNNGNSESAPSDTVSIQVPSLDLPLPVITKAAPLDDKVQVQWQYPDIADIKGFRLYRDGQVVANESELKKTMREYNALPPSPGTTATFTIKAVSESGLVSEASAPIQVVMPGKKKK